VVIRESSDSRITVTAMLVACFELVAVEARLSVMSARCSRV